MENVVRLLIVEDDEEDIQIITELFEEQKINVAINIARDGVKALEYLEERKNKPNGFPNLILLDLNLPRKNGIEFLYEMKAQVELKKIPVIVLSSSQSQQDILKSYMAGASCYITKPIDINEFQNAIETLDNFWFKIVKYS